MLKVMVAREHQTLDVSSKAAGVARHRECRAFEFIGFDSLVKRHLSSHPRQCLDPWRRVRSNVGRDHRRRPELENDFGEFFRVAFPRHRRDHFAVVTDHRDNERIKLMNSREALRVVDELTIVKNNPNALLKADEANSLTDAGQLERFWYVSIVGHVAIDAPPA